MNWQIPVDGDAIDHFNAGIKASMKWLNTHYLQAADRITDDEINTFVASQAAAFNNNAKEAINTQAWILHMMNPNEAYANLRRSDYPVLADRTKLPVRDDFPKTTSDLRMPTRLTYPVQEQHINIANWQAAVDRMDGKDNWHNHVWWDRHDIKVK
jgi:hypothetical protein